MAKLVPESAQYIHDAEGPDDMPAHIRAAPHPHLRKYSHQSRSIGSGNLARNLCLGA